MREEKGGEGGEAGCDAWLRRVGDECVTQEEEGMEELVSFVERFVLIDQLENHKV